MKLFSLFLTFYFYYGRLHATFRLSNSVLLKFQNYSCVILCLSATQLNSLAFFSPAFSVILLLQRYALKFIFIFMTSILFFLFFQFHPNFPVLFTRLIFRLLAMKKDVQQPLDYESVLKHIGQFGPWQRWIFFWMCLVSAASGLLVVVYVFTGFEPKYRCSVPICENASTAEFGLKTETGYSFPDFVMAGIPKAALEQSNLCQYYAVKEEVKPNYICNLQK